VGVEVDATSNNRSKKKGNEKEKERIAAGCRVADNSSSRPMALREVEQLLLRDDGGVVLSYDTFFLLNLRRKQCNKPTKGRF